METRRRSYFEKYLDSLSLSQSNVYETLNEKDKRRVSVQVETGFHSYQLGKIRREIGRKLTYIGHSKDRDGNYIKANLITSEGKKSFNFKLQVPPSDMNENDYNYILEQLQKIK